MYRLEVGFDCNNLCVFCAQGRLRDLAPPPPLDTLFEQVDTLAEDSSGVLAFSGGEPTLGNRLFALASRARDAGFREILVQTNGRRLAARGYARALAGAGVTRLEVALQGSTAAMHDYHTGVPGSFKATVAGVARARAAGLGFVSTTVITRSNFRHLSEIVRLAHTLGARGLAFGPLAEAGSAATNAARLSVPPALLRPHFRRALELGRVLGLVCGGPELGRQGGPLEGWLAGIGTREPVDAPDGAPEPKPRNVFPLERLVRPKNVSGLQSVSSTR